MGKIVYGWSQKTGKLVAVGDEENLPKQGASVLTWLIVAACLLSVMCLAIISIAPYTPLRANRVEAPEQFQRERGER